MSIMSSMITQSRPFDVADEVHHLRDVGAVAALVDDGQVALEPLGERAGALDAAGVGRDDDQSW